MAVVMSYDKSGVLRVSDMRLATPLIFDRVAVVDVGAWSTNDEVASKTQSWETVNETTGAITGSNAVS
jgi:hypothetical protein